MAGDTLHVRPLDDLIEHELTEECVCGPQTIPSMREDGSNGWLVVHNSLDGREQQERAAAAAALAEGTPA